MRKIFYKIDIINIHLFKVEQQLIVPYAWG